MDYEMTFCGYSASGKTTLIARLIKELSPQFKIGYVKHDVHSFQMDEEGKDTFLVRESGAHSVFISDAGHCAYISKNISDPTAEQTRFLDEDMVFIEGYKDSPWAKILLIDENILPEIKKGRFQNIKAFVGPKSGYGELPPDIPYFQRDNIQGIKQFLCDHFAAKVKSIPLYGLILAGGQSTRMGKDKSVLSYHGKSQIEFCHDLLSPHCTKVFVSNRKDQAKLAQHNQYDQIHDTFLGMGPLGGILSAMTQYPDAAWLVLACDLPYLNEETIRELIAQRNPYKMATAYISEHDGLPEPLCAVYEPKSKIRFFESLGSGITCPRKILMHSDISLLPQKKKHSLDNINHFDEYQKARREFQERLEKTAHG